MTKTLIDRASVVADLMKLSNALGMAASVEPDGNVWLHGPVGHPARHIGDTAAEAVRYLECANWRCRY
jgi:hypothetical protein